MKNKTIVFLLFVILSASLLLGCGERKVDVDTLIFDQPTPTHQAQSGTLETTDIPPEYTSGTKKLDDMLADGTAVQYERAVLNDPLLGCEVARTLMPNGWTSGGEVSWNGQSGTYPAVYNFFIQAPENKAVLGMVSGCTYVEPDPNWVQWYPGQILEGSLAPAKALLTPSEYNVELISMLFPVQNLQLIATENPEGEAVQALEKINQIRQESIDAQNIQSGFISTHTQCSTNGSNDTLSFDLNGKRCKAKVFSVHFVDVQTTQSEGVYSPIVQKTTLWTVPIHFYYVAEEDVFDLYEQEAFSLFSGNFLRNHQWENALINARDQAFAMEANRQAEQWQQTQQLIQQQASSYSASSQQDYSSTHSSGSSSGYDTDVMGGWTNAITGNSYYEAPDGGHVLLDYNQHHYTDGSSIYSSSEPLNIGGTNLSPLNDIGTMGGD